MTTHDQGELFGEIGGLFGPAMIETTPVDELTLPRESAPPVLVLVNTTGTEAVCKGCPWPAADSCPGRGGLACSGSFE